MQSDLNRELLQDFIIEAKEHFDVIENSLIELEKNPEDFLHIHNIFRAFHTIKGNAALLKLESIKELSHQAENMLVLIRDEKVSLATTVVDVILESTDILKQFVISAESGGSFEYDLEPVFGKINSEIEKIRSQKKPDFLDIPPLPVQQAVQPVSAETPREKTVLSLESDQYVGKEKKISVGRAHLATKQWNNIFIITVAGEMDVQGTDILLKELVKIADNGFCRIVLGLGKLKSMSCCCLGAMWATLIMLREKNGSLKLYEVQPEVERKLDVTRLLNRFEIFDSLEEAVRSF